MKALSEWSILDSFVNALFVKLLGADPAPGAAMFASLSGSSARRGALDAVASVGLAADELEVFKAIFSLYRTGAKERNKIAHWIWGYSPVLPHAVLLCDPNVKLRYDAEVEVFMRAGAGPELSPPVFPRDQLFVYSEPDFVGLSNSMQRLMDLVARLTLVLHRGHPVNWEGAKFAQLSQEPEIRDYIDRHKGAEGGG